MERWRDEETKRRRDEEKKCYRMRGTKSSERTRNLQLVGPRLINEVCVCIKDSGFRIPHACYGDNYVSALIPAKLWRLLRKVGYWGRALLAYGGR
jgi:hypothetical protein